MEKWSEWEKYLDLLCEVVGHKERHNSLRDYCSALVLPIERKSVERLAAYIDPMKVPQKH